MQAVMPEHKSSKSEGTYVQNTHLLNILIGVLLFLGTFIFDIWNNFEDW